MSIKIQKRQRNITKWMGKNIAGMIHTLLHTNHAICPLVVESSPLDSSFALMFEYIGRFKLHSLN
ncbi:hypothetical protein [Helicobacter pullorum]|uniref:hypothetical protein n=1 Tax=Helicobacter pullorum TaxID=35818 RepID=UPI001651E2D7|nr:hypothetical protein [Helicobacter pullorum]